MHASKPSWIWLAVIFPKLQMCFQAHRSKEWGRNIFLQMSTAQFITTLVVTFWFALICIVFVSAVQQFCKVILVSCVVLLHSVLYVDFLIFFYVVTQSVLSVDFFTFLCHYTVCIISWFSHFFMLLHCLFSVDFLTFFMSLHCFICWHPHVFMSVHCCLIYLLTFLTCYVVTFFVLSVNLLTF